jgi:hypothetical protein
MINTGQRWIKVAEKLATTTIHAPHPQCHCTRKKSPLVFTKGFFVRFSMAESFVFSDWWGMVAR